MQDQHKNILNKYREVLILIFLFSFIFITYFQMHDYNFISLDDPLYVVGNKQVQKGLSFESICWAFSISKDGEVTNWHPLAWLSHMLDYQLFGLNAGMHHMTNVLIHALNTMLLFLALRLMTGSVWRSAFVASLFAFHPVNVDSVAWISERKNLLSSFFWMLTMIAYWFYARKQNMGSYLLVVVAFCLGLLAKPMLITLPFVLLLLDYWPLGRIGFPSGNEGKTDWTSFSHNAFRLVLEKIPLLILSIVFIYFTMLSLQSSHTIEASNLVSMDLKIKNAVVSYFLYLWKLVWPMNLSIFYPYPDYVPIWQVIGSSVLLLLISAAALLKYREYPYFVIGWLWFLGTLVPVLGIVQAGLWPAIGERWAYIPYIGLFITITWGFPDLLSRFGLDKKVLPVAAGVILVLCSGLTWNQIGCWKDDFTLFSKALAGNPENYVAHVNVAVAYAKIDNYEQALYHFGEAVRIHKTDTVALDGLGHVYGKIGQYDKSIQYYLEELRYAPRKPQIYNDLGTIYLAKGDLNDAFVQYLKVISLNPGNAPAYYSLGIIAAKRGDLEEAVEYLSTAIRLNPNDTQSHCILGVVLMNLGKVHEAVAHFQEALNIDPGSSEAHNYLNSAKDFLQKAGKGNALEQKSMSKPDNPESLKRLAALYSTRGENEKALDVLYSLVKIQPENPDGYYNVACVLAKDRKVSESIEWLKKSVDKGFRSWDLLKKDPDLQNLRNTEYYRELVKGKG